MRFLPPLIWAKKQHSLSWLTDLSFWFRLRRQPFWGTPLQSVLPVVSSTKTLILYKVFAYFWLRDNSTRCFHICPQASEATQTPTQVRLLHHFSWSLSPPLILILNLILNLSPLSPPSLLRLSAHLGPVSDRTCASHQSQGGISAPPVQKDIQETGCAVTT